VRRLRGLRAALAFAFCSLLLAAGLLVPVAWLAWNAWSYTPELARLAGAARNSIALALAGALLTTALAGALAIGGARMPLAARLASLGYATPGAAIAIGLLVPASFAWQAGGGGGYWTAIALLLYAYAARLMAAALEPIDSGLARVTPSMLHAGRSLGRSESGVALAVQLPVARGAFLTAAFIVFIDILKELPATLILRPFDFDTLAVIANNYALDERLGQAGWPALGIIMVALPPTIWLSRKIAASRPGT
jgi:iron(III) transport system permease protein